MELSVDGYMSKLRLSSASSATGHQWPLATGVAEMEDPMIPVPRFASLLGIQVAWDASEANFSTSAIYQRFLGHLS